jgi:hypothetical protein
VNPERRHLSSASFIAALVAEEADDRHPAPPSGAATPASGSHDGQSDLHRSDLLFKVKTKDHTLLPSIDVLLSENHSLGQGVANGGNGDIDDCCGVPY